MHENDGRSKSERKKARRRERAASDRAGGKALIELADAAVDEAVSLLDRIEAEHELGLTTEMPTLAAAEYCRKRINEALGYREWLDEVEVWWLRAPNAGTLEPDARTFAARGELLLGFGLCCFPPRNRLFQHTSSFFS